ncbi:A-kinase anchor protein 14 [Centropristis striata]|uniref:A-kinase anchor protein 14 n=1 Tax=Centropristis striata TaxID=184440 RepID=UPI0027DFC8E1|nr:A-kinase anchor protein 14 [Centropristis striata]
MGEEGRSSFNPNLTTESAQLVKTLLERQQHSVSEEQEEEEDSPGRQMETVHWVSSEDFTVEVGKRQIEEYLQTWELQPCWLHSLDFLSSTEEQHSTFYHYRARFSTPTSRRPVQGTARVYFVVDISKVKPQTLPAEVHFVVESNRLVHSPGRTRFREEWLEDVIESKTLLRRAVSL